MTANDYNPEGSALAPLMRATSDLQDDGPVKTRERRPGVSGASLSDDKAARAGRHNVASPTILLIDNYDSFTFNLYHRLGELGARISVYRNDALTAAGALALGNDAVVISPGPCDPDRAGISIELIRQAALERPVLGVCLGHQAIGQAFGGLVVRAPMPMHGKISLIHHDNTGIFKGAPNPFPATRYHSLIVDRGTLPSDLMVNAWTEDGLIMGLRHKHLPTHGVQFHPESIETSTGYVLLRNFLGLITRADNA